MVKKISLIVAASLLLALVMTPQSARSADDKFARDFFSHCAEWSYGEIEMSKLATTADSSVGVRRYAESQVSAYTTMLEEARTIAKEKGYPYPKEMGSKQRDTFEHLQKYRGREFDARYMKDQVDEQKAMLDMFEKGSKDFGEASLRDWAGKWHKNIKARYDDAVTLYEKVKM